MRSGELRVCNLDYLMDLAKGDDQFVKEMLDVFLEENPEEMHKIEMFIEARDYAQIKQLAHKLRSSIPYVGLDTVIGDDIADIEESASQASGLAKIRSAFMKVKEVCALACEELSSLRT